MLSRIPSWAVAVAGTSIVIIATGIGFTLLHQTRADIDTIQTEIADMRGTVERLWGSHLQADQRSAAADVFFALALAPSSHQSFLLDKAASQLRGAVLSMRVASGEEVPDETPASIATFENQLRDGNVLGYNSLKYEIDQLRLTSQSYLNTLAKNIRAEESRLDAMQMRESWIYLAYMFFNFLGLIVVMCKDLPVWRVDHRGERAA